MTKDNHQQNKDFTFQAVFNDMKQQERSLIEYFVNMGIFKEIWRRMAFSVLELGQETRQEAMEYIERMRINEKLWEDEVRKNILRSVKGWKRVDTRDEMTEEMLVAYEAMMGRDYKKEAHLESHFLNAVQEGVTIMHDNITKRMNSGGNGYAHQPQQQTTGGH